MKKIKIFNKDCRDLSSFIKDKIDFIKLDLEGFDLLALKGSVNHILNDYPSMAIAVYHEISHIYEIFNFVIFSSST
jgi:hypothetical protein